MDRHLLTFRRWLAVFALLALSGTMAVVAAEKAEKDKIPWHTDLKSAHKVAVREQKPLLLVFGAEWCGYCKKLEKETLEQPAMAAYVRREFVPVHIDLDENEEIAEILEVQAIPCTIVLSPEVDLLARIDGYVKAKDYETALKKARQLQDKVRQVRYSEPSSGN